MLEPVMTFYRDFWGVGPFIFWGRRLCAPNVTTNRWRRFTPGISTPIISIRVRCFSGLRPTLCLSTNLYKKVWKTQTNLSLTGQILTKRSQKKSEWMIANNMVQIWAPTYLHMLFVRPFFGWFWNLGQPSCKHFSGVGAQDFVSLGGWVRLHCSYKMVTQVDPPNSHGDLVKVKHRKFVILESDLLLTFKRTDSCLKVKRNRFDVLLHVVS